MPAVTQLIHVVKTTRRKRLPPHPLRRPCPFLSSEPRTSWLLRTGLASHCWWSVHWCPLPALTPSPRSLEAWRCPPPAGLHVLGKTSLFPSLYFHFYSFPFWRERNTHTHTPLMLLEKKIKISHLKWFFPLLFFSFWVSVTGYFTSQLRFLCWSMKF